MGGKGMRVEGRGGAGWGGAGRVGVGKRSFNFL